MRKQTIHPGPPPERRTMGLRWGSVRSRTASSRNDDIHLFSTENNARRIREALEELDAGGGYRMDFEELLERSGGGRVRQAAQPTAQQLRRRSGRAATGAFVAIFR